MAAADSSRSKEEPTLASNDAHRPCKSALSTPPSTSRPFTPPAPPSTGTAQLHRHDKELQSPRGEVTTLTNTTSEEHLAKMVNAETQRPSQMANEEKLCAIAELRRRSYPRPRQWKIPHGYDWSRDTANNYAVAASDANADGDDDGDSVDGHGGEYGEDVGMYASVRRASVDHEYHGRYSRQRQLFQDWLISAVLQDASPQRHPWVIFTAGPMGAGKSHTLQWMSERGYFPLVDVVQLDSDKFKNALPEWPEYVRRDTHTAGRMTKREAGLLVEIAQTVAMSTRKHVWVDGSFRNAEWFEHVFADIRRNFADYRIAILYVHARKDVVLRRARSRAEHTQRYVPEEDILDSLKQVPEAVDRLGPKADFVALIDNSNDEPKLSGWCTESGACHLNVCGSWDEISKRFAVDSQRRSEQTWFRLLRKIVSRQLVVLFGKSYCQQTARMKQLLYEADVDFTEVKLDAETLGGVSMLEVLQDLTHSATTPMLFVNGEFVGGLDDVRQLREAGELAERVSRAASAAA